MHDVSGSTPAPYPIQGERLPVEVISHVMVEDGSVHVSVKIPKEEKLRCLHKASDFILAEFGTPCEETELSGKLEVLYGMLGKEEVLDMITSFLMGYLASTAVEKIGCSALLAPECTAENDILENGDFIFSLDIVPKPFCRLRSYDPVTISPLRLEDTSVILEERLHTILEASEASELSDNLAHRLFPGITTVEDLRTELAKSIESEKGKQMENYRIAATEAELMKRLEGDIPPVAYHKTQKGLFDEVCLQARCQGMELIDFLESKGLDEVGLGVMLRDHAVESVNRSLALDALASYLGFGIDDDDIQAALEHMAPGEGERVYEDYKERDLLAVVEETALRLKAQRWLLDTATEKEPLADRCV